MSRTLPIVVLLTLWSAAALAVDPQDTLMLEQPDIDARHITFIYDGDVWVANRDGSGAYRLTTAEGQESLPHFSPDGASIAFSGNYDGNVDVYVVAVAGGSPKRLTWHSEDDLVEGWDLQGHVIFSSQSDVYTSRDAHLFTIDPKATFPERLPIPSGLDADVSPDGRAIAYAMGAQAQWKMYRGGTASRISIMGFADHAVQRIPQPPERCNDINPMWIGGKLYFNSDRHGEFNLHSFDPASGAVQQLTSYADFPVVNASAGDGKIIFEQAGHLRVFDPQTSNTTTLRVAVASDLRETRPRRVSNVDYVRNVSPAPDLTQVALEYRGEVVTVPAQKGGPIRNLTQSTGANDRTPAWSPKGGKIAWFSDESGDYALYVADSNGSGKPRRIAIEGGSGFYLDPKWSPDEKHVSFLDNAYSLFVLDIDTGRVQRISENQYFGHAPYISHNWSPDSQWLVYTQNTNGLVQAVYVYSIAQRKSSRITDGLTEVSEPVFDRNGRYLYVIASDQAGPIKDWFSQASIDLSFTHSLYAIALRKGDPSPLPLEGETPAPATPTAPAPSPTPQAPPAVTIDFDGIGDRIVPLPTAGATLRGLQAGKSGELYYLWTPATPAITALEAPGELKRFVMKERAAKTLIAGVDAYFLSQDGEKVLLRQGKSLKVAPAGGEIKPESATAVALEDVSILIDPRAEWRQILREAWRLNRDFFYAPTYHGVDWNAMWKKYEPFLDHCATRSDVARVMASMASELRVGHSYSGGGESISKPPNVGIGLLGADFEVADGRYRFKKVYGGLNWRPELRAPLRAPGISVAEGEYLLAVDGKPLTTERNVYSAFENLVEKPVEISVGPRADGQGARTLRVVPIANERELRYVDWVEGNIRKVDAATGGRVAYVHVPDTAVAGHAAFKRYFFPQSQKEALILDDRNNGGGYVADYYIDILRKQPVIYWATRYGKNLRTPRGAIYGTKVMLANEGAGSGGDLLPWMFHKLGLGQIVGTRTWGGLVGNLGIHTLMDGGTITAPNIAGWTPEDGWVIENQGVPPDIEVEMTPQAMLAGRDPQLEKAIEIALQGLKEHPAADPQHPPYPIKTE
ncbi:MAG TPA: PDZ domain-containing protein [Steroidobacteraceae bacterium]|nr:PDZ domain-containing protein [Steroidobacteraceae bacterium]